MEGPLTEQIPNPESSGNAAGTPPSASAKPRMPTTDFDAIDTLIDEISDLWGHLNAATARFLSLVARFDRIEGWVPQGCSSCAHWLTLKCGIGAVAAREKVRVARALQSLPSIAGAFQEGRISYSKVRAMTRIATSENETTLLQIALYGTASHVERIVRQYRRVERIEDAERSLEQHRQRFVDFSYDDDGMIVIHARIPAEQGEVIRRALKAAIQASDAAAEDAPEANARDRSASATPAESRNEPPPDPASAAPDQSRKGRNVSAEASLPRPWGARHLRDDHDSSDDPQTESRRPVAARRADALFHLCSCYLDREAERCPSSASRYQVVVRIDQSLLRRAAVPSVPSAEASGTGPGCCEIEDGPALALDAARRLACHSSLVGLVHDKAGNPLDIGRRTRAIPAAIERALKDRDGGCRFPGCDRTRYTEGHHVRHWADGGETKLSNLITLCHFHHRLLHEGGFRLQPTGDGTFVFRTPQGERVQSAALQSDRRFRGNIADLNAQQGVSVRRPPGWHGERMDSSLVIDALLRAREQSERSGPGSIR